MRSLLLVVSFDLRSSRYYFLSECYCLKYAVLFLWGALSDERTDLQFAVQSLNSPSRSEPVTILYSQLRLPQPGGLGSRIYIPRNRVAQLYPRALGSLYVVSCGSQGYGGGTRPCIIAFRNRMVQAKVKVTLRRTASQSYVLVPSALGIQGVRSEKCQSDIRKCT
jgi:hypothetical protein